MKKAVALFMLVAVSIGLWGCSLWMDGSYSMVTPHQAEQGVADQQNIEVETYAQLDSALLDQVEAGRSECVLYSRTLTDQQLKSYMETAKRGVLQGNAVGAYAVNEISYEIGKNSGRTAIAVHIDYAYTRSEILRIKTVETMADAQKLVTKALENCDPGITLRVTDYENVDFAQMVQDYVDQNPQTCMEMPQVNAASFPQTGSDRIVDVTFTYQTSRESLRNMQQIVQPVFSSAKLYVSLDASYVEKYGQLYAFLMGRDTYTVQTSLTPAYSLLKHGVGDSKAFASVYSAMCRQSDLDCQVISGTRDGEPWCWNVLMLEGAYYHLDILRCDEQNGFALKTEEEMVGYVWDYSAFTQTENE